MFAIRATLILLLFAATFVSKGQTQLVLLSRERVMARYSEGQPFSYKLKKSNKFKVGYIVQVNEFSVITTYDTIPFASIEKIGLKTHYHGTKLFGSLLFDLGLGYYAIDEANSILVHKEGYDNDKSVWVPSAIFVGTGIILKLIRRRSMVLHYPVKLFAAPRGSSFWRPE